MKVLHVVPSLDDTMGGSIHAAVSICSGLNSFAVGIDASIASTVAPDDQLGYLDQWSAEPAHVFARTAPRARFYSRGLRRWLAESVSDYELVHIHGVFQAPALMTGLACRRRGVPYVVQPHGQLDPFDLEKHRLVKRVLGPLAFRRLLAESSGVITTASTEADRLHMFGADPPRYVAPLGVRFDQATGDGPLLRRELGIPPEATVLLFLGRIDPKKGLDLLIQALARIRHDCPSVVLILAGDGEADYKRHIAALIESHDLQTLVVEVGFVTGSRKMDVLAASDLFVLPSRNENFGIAIVEALAAGLPVLISTEVYIHDMLEQEEVGVVCRPTVDSLSATLEVIIADGERRSGMASRARSAAARHFSLEAAASALTDVYRHVLATERSAS